MLEHAAAGDILDHIGEVLGSGNPDHRQAPAEALLTRLLLLIINEEQSTLLAERLHLGARGRASAARQLHLHDRVRSRVQ